MVPSIGGVKSGDLLSTIATLPLRLLDTTALLPLHSGPWLDSRLLLYIAFSLSALPHPPCIGSTSASLNGSHTFTLALALLAIVCGPHHHTLLFFVEFASFGSRLFLLHGLQYLAHGDHSCMRGRCHEH